MPEQEGPGITSEPVSSSSPERSGETFSPNWIMTKEGEFKDNSLRRAAERLHKRPEEQLSKDDLLRTRALVEDRYIAGSIDEGEGGIFLDRLDTKITELEQKTSEREATAGSKEDLLLEMVRNTNMTMRSLTEFLEQSPAFPSVPTADQLAGMSQDAINTQQLQRGDALRELFGRVEPEVEKSRWIDAEYEQDFFQRFQPNAEPYFYAKIEDAGERAKWDARWKLARAATYKNLLSGRADKLIENQDLIGLTTEQMETLYNMEGVRYGLEWYVGAMVRGDKTVNGKKLLECERGSDFEALRKLFREELQRDVFGVTPDQRQAMTEKERVDLDMRVKGADAIAWNWVYCSNLAESLDSRYSNIGSYHGQRHDHLAPGICSDDLRAVFHPQEKFENKAQSGQEWGVFGRWGKIQMERIKKENPRVDIVFKAARKGKEYWSTKTEGGRVVVTVPECYPTTTMRSFFEEYKVGDEGGTRSLFECLLTGEQIDWSKVMADPWKTSYQTVKMVKAVGLTEHFKEPDSRKPWLKGLLDFYVRLGLEKRLNEKDKQEGAKAGTSFHNLKVWAIWAVKGGVGMPHVSGFTNPWTKSRHFPSTEDQRTLEILLRKPDRGFYLGKRENLLPWDR